jgi:NAD(P)-dependent dehydrogenase (short-subunit alcohol dehydrogenase family)
MNSPGAIETNGSIELVNEEQWKKMVENIVKSTPLRRIGEPLDIAKGIVFLSSIDAQFITGANLVIDGGIMFG